MLKRLLSASVLAVMMLAPGIANAADYGLPANIQDGNILHCFNWKLSDVKAELPNIAAAGFGAVQVSPLQRNVSTAEDWSTAYRPYDFKFIASTALGSAEDLKSLCSEAANYGIKIVVDVVENHVDGHGAGDHTLYHDPWWNSNNRLRWNGNVDYNDRYSITHNQMGGADGYPDVNSEDLEIASRGRAYIEELKRMGVKGIRFDAAKHVALPSEGCQFWATVTSVSDMWYYGEILDNPGGGNGDALMKEYTNYMSVTDNNYGDNATKNGGVPTGHMGWGGDGSISSSKFVYWGESHDTYSNNDGFSKYIDQSVVDRAYAAVACRDGAAALYLSRPFKQNFSDIKLGVKGSTAFTGKHIAAVNKFRNAMIGKKDYFTLSGDACSITRQGGGAVIVMKGSGNVSIANGGGYCPAGTYTDLVSGGKFTVTASTISGPVGSSGIAVLMDGQGGGGGDIDPPSGSVTITGDYNLAYSGSKSMVYYWGGSSKPEWPGVAMSTATGSDGKTYKVFKVPTGTTSVIFNNGSDADKTADLTYSGSYVMDDNGATSTAVTFSGGGGGDDEPTGEHYVYYDGMFSVPQVWAWVDDNTSCTTATAWPGDNMTQKDGKWYWEVPVGKPLPRMIIIHEGDNKIGGGDLTYVDKATYHQDGTYTPAGEEPVTKPVVSASPASTSFTESITVTLSVSPDATIYYTTDGNAPTTSSSKYSTPLTFTSTTTLKAFGVTADGTQGDVKTFTYTKGSTPPPVPTPGDNLITDYYKVNPNGQYGTNKTINVTGHPATNALSNWTEAELIAQGVARDVCQAFKGVHERPIVDSYALYAAYDSENLYLGVQYVYTVWDIGGEGKQGGESKPYNMDGKLCIAFDLDPNASYEGITNEGTSIWQNGVYTTFNNGADAWWYGSTKPGTGTPGYFVPNASGICDYTDPNSCKTSEVVYGYTDGLLPSITAIYGQDDFSYDPELLKGNTGFTDLRSEAEDSWHTFYEYKFPLSMMGITEDYIKNNGIGVMVVDFYGASAHASLPYDPSFFDNVFEEYSQDPSSSGEKEDKDVVTYSMARVGKGATLSTNVVNSDRDFSGNFRLGNGCIEFYGLNGESVSVSSIDGRTMFSSRATSDVTVDLPSGIYIVNIDGVGKAVRVL